MAMRVLILGGGPAGYAAAVTAASLGADTTLVERERVGGACTLWDAIPSKTLLNTADGFASIEHAQHAGLDFECGEPSVDFDRMISRVNEVVNHQCEGVAQRLASSGVRVVQGEGRLVDRNTLAVRNGPGQTSISFDRLIVATGAHPWVPDGIPAEHPRVLTTRTMWEDLDGLPESLAVVGSGATGCEMADFFQRCGTAVTLVSSRDRILPTEDVDVAWVVEDAFLQRGMTVLHRSRAAGVDAGANAVTVDLGSDTPVTASHVLFAVGMTPNTAGIGLDDARVERNDKGGIIIDEYCLTSTEGIYAVGDETGGVMLANVASMQGRHAALHAVGADVDPIRYESVASTVFTQPEIADVGLTESAAAAQERDVATVVQPLRNNPRAVIHGATAGLVKLVFDPVDGTILGGSIVGLRASELIITVGLAVHAGLSVSALAETGAVNPSVSESLQRAAERAAASLPGLRRPGGTSSVALGG